jgi:hypothetical protein
MSQRFWHFGTYSPPFQYLNLSFLHVCLQVISHQILHPALSNLAIDQ